MIYKTPVRPDELYHHGRKGMHWGERNGPPYPLDSKVVKRLRKQRFGSSHVEPVDAVWNKYNKERVTKEQLINTYDRRVANEDPKTALKIINDYKSWYGAVNNCMKCSVALILRQMGYDVKAGQSIMGIETDALDYWFKGVIIKNNSNSTDAVNKIVNDGNGSYGIVGITRTIDVGNKKYPVNGHSAFYKYDGKNVNIYDGQIGSSYNSLDSFISHEDADKDYTIVTMRMDKAIPIFERLSEDHVVIPR